MPKQFRKKYLSNLLMSRIYTQKGLGLFVLGLFFACVIATSCDSSQKIPKVHIVEIRGMKFVPEELHLSKGDTVIWVNKDLVMHDVTEESKKAWASGIIASKSSWKRAITNSSDYYCNLHVVMKGKLVVD